MKRTAAAALVLASAFVARADEVVTQAGTSYGGKIVAEDATSVTVDSPALGRMRIARAEIAAIKRDADAAAPSKPGQSAPEQPAPQAPAADAAGPAERVPAAAAPAADPAATAAEEREARRKSARVVRRTDPRAGKPAATEGGTAAPAAAPVEEPKASLGGTQLAKAERGAWVVVFQPPTKFEAAPSGIQIGRRVYARLDSVGASSAWLAVPMMQAEDQLAVRLCDVQRHSVVKTGASRIGMIEGIDRGAWLRLRLDDGTVVEGVLQAAQNGSISLSRLSEDGSASSTFGVEADKVVVVDGLMRSTVTRMTLADTPAGEPIALTLWPDAREIVGVVRSRTELFLDVGTVDGSITRVAVDGPVAEARRVPAKWRPTLANLDPRKPAHARSAEEFPDSRVERDLVGTVAAITSYAVTLDTADGVVVMPFDGITALAQVTTDAEASTCRPMKSSDRACDVPVLPGAAAAKAQGLDLSTGVSALTDGTVVRNVFVTAPFSGEVYGIHIGERMTDARSGTDLRFDTIVTPRRDVPGGETRRTEMISNSLEGLRVTMELDSASCVSSIEISAR